MTYSLNSRALNSAAVNGTGVQFDSTGAGQLVALHQSVQRQEAGASLAAIAQAVQALPSAGSLVVLAQAVTRSGQGSLGAFEQTIALRQTGSGQLVGVVQALQSAGAGAVLTLVQRVRSEAARYQFRQPSGVTGISAFDIAVTIGGLEIGACEIIGSISIERGEGESALATLTLRPPAGVQNLNKWHGKSVIIDALDSAGVVHRLYTGTVDIPEIDLIDKRITLRCTDKRKERDNALPAAFVSGIGYHSEAVFGEPKDQADELEQRLKTIPCSWDYAPNGVGHLTPWQPKASADWTIADASVYRRTPSVTVLSRGRVTNRITLELEYQYQRLRHRELSYSFASGLSACLYGAWGMPPTTVQLRQAIEHAGWPYTRFEFQGLDPGGRYSCNGSTLLWSTIRRTGESAPRLDSEGNQVVDAAGNPVYDTKITSSTDVRNVYAQSATWKASKRWAQNITERITLTVEAPQSISQYGLVEREQRHGLEAEYDAEEWETYEAYAPAPAEAKTSGNGDKIIDQDSDSLPDWHNMALTALAKARTEIETGHRDNRVSLETPFWPQLSLRHTVETTGGTVRCKGKVSRIRHALNISTRSAYTELDISLSQSVGSASDSSVTLPARPAVVDSGGAPSSIWLGTHTVLLGGTQNDTWTGYIFRELARMSSLAPYGFKRPVAMIIDTPAIDDASRDTLEVESATTHTLAIRNDLLEVEF